MADYETADDRRRAALFDKNVKLRKEIGSVSLGNFSVSELPAILRILKVESYPDEITVWEARLKDLKSE